MNLRNIILSIEFCLLCILLIGNSEAAIVLSNGAADSGEASVNNPEYVLKRTLEIAMYGKTSDPEGISVGYTNMGLGDIYYMLSDGLLIHKINLPTKTLLGNWPLTPWTNEPIEPEVTKRYDMVRRVFSQLRPAPTHPLGCLNAVPLRYGDIDSDGTNELVLFIGNELMVFSPSMQKTVFAMNMRLDDWMTEAETQAHFEYYPPGDDDAFIPHYQSAANVDYASSLPGYRGYGKLYTGDYDNDGSSDILVWRKLYISRTLTAAKGFDKVSDTYYHYEKSGTGEYILQNTASQTIQNWLSTAVLTWQKGFPSNSECTGEEGQLIPEMHDPLLNDPEVLQ